MGTPLSSLMAWVEVIREDPDMKHKGVVEELEKDIQKLRIVTERFSSIGSIPSLKKENVVSLINNVVNYLRPRVSSKVRMEVFTLSENIFANVHAPLFEWVIENLCKNAVDAMGNTGTIAIKILRGNEGKVFIDISDTGKGIPRSKLEHVFRPGFTTKKRGWGLADTCQKNYRSLPQRQNFCEIIGRKPGNNFQNRFKCGLKKGLNTDNLFNIPLWVLDQKTHTFALEFLTLNFQKYIEWQILVRSHK